ncbi:MAG: phycobiliprotein lyase [Synechococcus sp.]|jgi:hypothetical protein|uniref:phycobiliprotein lyase n=1 Tax=Synechococcus sp. BMK-MC-1 TaxID=1442551 RepID=UPI0016481C26|nr:phycobiliprotein lyase [Synechococcus sp. BMK-MC-1]QNI68123.1 putative phycobilin lyase [Synechococcus sp. BMK-MC-1]
MDETAFPPADLEAFLQMCAGRWMSLRSRFDLEAAEDQWHTSDRGEVTVNAARQGSTWALTVEAADGASSELLFAADGALTLRSQASERLGHWQFRPDASVELEVMEGDTRLLERIWFIKPNLRLRSTTATAAEGTPVQARFCSEIRRVSPPQP